MVVQAQQFLNSRIQAANVEQIAVRDPVTGEVFDHIPNSTPEMVAEAVRRARAAQPAWAAMSVKDRSRILQRFADLMMQQQERVIKVIRRETGKSHGSAYAEVVFVALMGDYYSHYAPRWLKPEKRRGFVPFLFGGTIYHKPYGVVGNIAPWNYPLALSLVDMVPALLAGNAVVVKPSEITPFSTMEAMRILYEADLPENVFQIITGYGPTGAALIEHVDYVMFTGSTATGRKIAVRAAERLIPCSLELGGNTPFIVLRDADLDQAATCALKSGFENAGQACISVQRIMVEEAVYPQFLEALKKWHAELKVGKGGGFEVHMGSVTNARELERVEGMIKSAQAKGARLLAGGSRLEHLGPLFHEATILADVPLDADVMHYEAFGPLIAVTPVQDVEEALRVANASNYGLSAAVWSRDVKRAQAIANRIETGDVTINTVLLGIGSPSMEHGGVKESGIGRRNGKQGLLKYTVTQSITVDRFPLPPEPTLYTAALRRMYEFYRQVQKIFPFTRP